MTAAISIVKVGDVVPDMLVDRHVARIITIIHNPRKRNNHVLAG